MKEAWIKIVKDILHKGQTFSPRGQEIKEIEDYNFYMDPFNRFFSFEERKLNIKYAFAEFAWYLKGNPNDSMMEHYASLWKKIKNKQPPFWHSNYGEYIFKEQQFQFVINTLKKDKDSRQACITINRPSVMMSDTMDKICTNSLSFRIRNNKLNMSVSMRSNDFVYGFTSSDFIAFTLLQELIFWHLKENYPELEMGKYFHKADSFHVYEKHYEMLNKIANNDGLNWKNIDCPKISCFNEAILFMELLPYIELQSRLNKLNLNLLEEQEIPESFKFIRFIFKLFI